MAQCSCSAGNSNTGTLSCKQMIGVARKLIVVQKTDSTGTRNSIDITGSTNLDQAFFDALVNNSDTSKRWYPLPNVDNVEDVTSDPLTETLNSQEVLYIKQGIRTWSGVMVQETPKTYGDLVAMQCVDNAVYVIDSEGQLIGEVSSDGTKLYPLDITKSTWTPSLYYATDTTTQKVGLKFSFNQDIVDENINMIIPSEMNDVNLLTLNGLLDCETSGSPSASAGGNTVTAIIQTDFGTAMTHTMVEGLGTDVTVYNTTTSAAIAITGSTEATAGHYVFSHGGGVNLNDVLTLAVNKDGYSAATIATITAGA